MIIQNKTVLKEYFETGDKPTQQQYWSLIDSLRHVHDKIPLIDLQEDVLSQEEFQSHLDNATFNGDVTAVNFIGDGSQLTGISLDNLPNDVAYTNLDNSFSSLQTFNEGLVAKTIDSDRFIYFKAPNGEDRFNFYTGGTGNSPYLDMYDSDGTTLLTRINTAGTTMFSNPVLINNSNTDGTTESLKINGSGSASSALIQLDRNHAGRTTGIYHSTIESTNWFEGIYYNDGSAQNNFGIGTSRNLADQLLILSPDRINFTTNVDLNGDELNFLGGSTDWKIYTSGDDLYIRETAIGDRVAFYDGGFTKFNLNNSAAEFNSNADASIKVSSNDPYTGIAFQDPNGLGYLFYNGINGYYLDNNLEIAKSDSQLTILDTDQTNVDIGDTQSSILLKGMYASGSIDSVFSQARLRLIKDQADGTAGSAFAIDVMNNAGGASVLTERFVIDSEGDFDFKNGKTSFNGLITGTAGMTLGSVASTTTRNPQYLVFGGSAGSEYGMELGYDATRAKYSTRIITSSSQDISFGAMNAPATDQTDFTEWFVIENGGNFDFKSGNAAFGGKITVSSDNNILADFASTDSIGEIRIADNTAYTRLLTSGVDFKIMPNDGAEVVIFEGDTLQTLLKGALDVATTGTFGNNVTAPNFLGDLIGNQITAGISNGSVQIRNNSGQPIATFTDALDTAFTGDISLKDDKFLYLGDANNARLFVNNTNTFFDGLTGNMYFRNQFDGGNMYFQVENLSGDDLDLIEIHGDTQDVLLRHANASRLQTTSEGVNIYGELSVVTSGSASPHADTDLFVADSTAAGSTSQIQILGGSAANSNLYFSDADNYAIGGIKYSHAYDSMTFRVNNHDLIELSDSKLLLGKNSTTGQVRIDYRKDSNNSNGWYTGYFSGSNINNSFGVYGYESDGDFRIYTNDTLSLTIDSSQNASFSGEIVATGTIMSNAGFSTGAQAANAGAIRLENEDKITSRNAVNSGNRTLMYLDSSNVLQLAESTDTNFGGKITAKDLQLNLQGADVAYIYGENDAQLRIKDISGNGSWSGIGFGTSTGTDGFLYHNSVGQYFQLTHQLQLLSGAYVPDSSYVYFGSSNDFRISHDGSDTLMDNYTGDIHFRNFTDGGSIYFYADTAEGVSTNILALDASTADINGEVKATSFTQNGTDVYLNISQHNTSTSKIFADANLRIEAGASANILFHVNGAERGRIDLNGLMTLKNGLEVTGNATATDFIGNWNGKATSDLVSATGNVNEDVTGTKVFTNGLTIGYRGSIDEKAQLSAKNTDTSVTTNLLEYGSPGKITVLEPAKFNEGLEATDYKVTGMGAAPASATAIGATGEIRYTADYIYVCVASNTWKRAALATW